MSYYKVRTCSVNPARETIKLSVADSSVRPLYYFSTEYKGSEGASFEQTLEDFFVSCMEGNFQFLPSCKISPYINAMYRAIEKERLSNVFDLEWRYKIPGLSRQVYQSAVKTYALPIFLQGENEATCLWGLMDALEALKSDIVATVQERQRELERTNLIPIRAASISCIFPGYDILLDFSDHAILAPRECYNNKGLLDNSSGKAIFFESNGSILWNVLGYGTLSRINLREHVGEDIEEYTKMERELVGKTAGLKMTTKPYLDYPCFVKKEEE